MTEYHKIESVFHRDPANKNKTFLEYVWTIPEFEYLANNMWDFEEKVDGTNIRVIIAPYGAGITFGGKTDNASIPATLVSKLQEHFLSQEAVLYEKFVGGAVLYGEGYGARIQKGGGNYRQDQDFVLFDVNVGGWWLSRKKKEEIAASLGLDVVPLIREGTLHQAIEMVRDGLKSQWGHFAAEGLVVRPVVELKTRSGTRIITKMKTKDFVR